MFDFPEFNILQPDMVISVFIVPLLIIFCWLHILAKRKFRLQEVYGTSLASISRLSTNKQDSLTLISILVVSISLVLALLRPQLSIEKLVPEYEKQDLILILDRSVSMQARDVPPSRFSRAIREIKSFLVNKPDAINRVGLIGFAGTSVILSHLTSDLETLFFFLDWIGEDDDVYYGTNVAGAINSAMEMVSKDDVQTKKTFLLVSDGDDESTELIDYLNQLNDAGIRVHTIGIGTDLAVPIPLGYQDGIAEYLLDEDGNQLITQFNESTLRQVASMTHGSFFRSSTGHELADSLNEVVRQEQKQTGLKRTVEHMDLYSPLLLLACIAIFYLFIRT
ncbi:MAG: Ca-activated chloride channel family protein [Gammaproteobacteria bacterium]|jgi:Ca-activated chloride channel family protein